MLGRAEHQPSPLPAFVVLSGMKPGHGQGQGAGRGGKEGPALQNPASTLISLRLTRWERESASFRVSQGKTWKQWVLLKGCRGAHARPP